MYATAVLPPPMPLALPPSPPPSGLKRSVPVAAPSPRLVQLLSFPPLMTPPTDELLTPISESRPVLHHLDIPFPSPDNPLTRSPTSPMDFDQDLPSPTSPMEFDQDLPPTPNTPNLDIHMHFIHDFSFYDKYRPIEFLPELDDIPSSPSLCSFASLPSLYDDDDDDDDDPLSSPPSPGATLVPLPGADPEDDLACPSDPPFSPGTSLLLLEDETLPRSPSPENCDVDPVCAENSADPDIRRLGALRRRSLLAERAARQFEQTLLEQGAVHQRWEARRARKKEKERGREIGAMLRLKMGQERERLRAAGGMVDEGEEDDVEKPAIGSMEQLVAKMLLRRNDTYRTLANRKTPLTFKFYKSSPLVRFGDSGDSYSESGPWTSSSPSSF